MKAQTMMRLVVVACLLLVFAILLYGTSEPTPAVQGGIVAQSTQASSAPRVVQQDVVSGGGYRLTSPAWQVSGAASGGAYHLRAPTSPSSGTMCCCSYLPCILKSQ
jgi:hypothetical protein